MSKYLFNLSTPEISRFHGYLFAGDSRERKVDALQVMFSASEGVGKGQVATDASAMDNNDGVVHEAVGCESCQLRRKNNLPLPVIDQVQYLGESIIVNMICECGSRLAHGSDDIDEGESGLSADVLGQIRRVVGAVTLVTQAGCGQRNGTVVEVNDSQ